MKFLITGFNKEQCTKDYYLGKELKILNSHYSLIRCLEDMGHEIEQRTVSIGEDLSGYDKVIIYLSSVKSFAHHAFDALYALKARPDAILANDDWQVREVFISFKLYEENLIAHKESGKPFFDYGTNTYLANLYKGDTPLEDMGKHIDTFIEACHIVNQKQNDLILCTFAGGNNDKFKIDYKGNIINYNPNPYNLNRKPENNYGEDIGLLGFFDDEPIILPPDEKKLRWIFSSIVQSKTMGWFNKQKPTWDVLNFGPRRETKQTKGIETYRVKEPEMCKIYNENWGCMMPEYYHAGSGWWRSRVQQVADVESVLVCSDAEGKIYGEAYVGNTIESVENMSVEELTRLGKAQKECLYDNHPLNKATQRSELLGVVE
jgi:hypothetical protein